MVDVPSGCWFVFAIQVPNPIAGGLEVVDPPPLSEDMMGWWMDGMGWNGWMDE